MIINDKKCRNFPPKTRLITIILHDRQHYYGDRHEKYTEVKNFRIMYYSIRINIPKLIFGRFVLVLQTFQLSTSFNMFFAN